MCVKQRNPEILEEVIAMGKALVRCTKCNKLLPETMEHFYRDKRKKNGLKSRCKDCCIKSTRKWQEENREYFLDKQREYRKNNKELRRELRRKHYRLNKEQEKFLAERFKRKNPDYYKRYYRRKRENDMQYRINQRIGSNIRMALIDNAHGRSWEKLVGYTLQELKDHLESQFEPGMTWDNHGYDGWHIDHIKPRHKFDFTSVDDPEFKKCWSLDNLRPLWAEDNRTGRPVAK